MRHNLIIRAATLAPTTFDAEANTVEVVLSTGADVQRGGYIERLSVKAADLANITGAPVLDAHNQGSTRAVLGIIQKAWKASGEIRALLKLSSRDDVAGIVRDIADGILRNLSIGYRVSRWADSTDSKGNRIRTAVAWTIHEASFVPVGADPGAQTRSNPMKKKSGANAAPENVEDENNESTVTETRAEIRDIIKRAGGTSEQADELIDADATVEQARAAAYELMTARTQSAPRVRIIASNDDPAATLERRTEALAVRVGGGKPSDAARQFVPFSLVDHARDMLEAAGVRTRGMNPEAILTRAMHTVSDFPELLTGTGARLLKAPYEAATSPLVALTRKVTASDFRTQSMLQLGEMPKLGKVSESGEIKSVTRGEAKESWALDTYGSIFSLSRRALINDDLSAFADFATAAGQAAANTVADLIVTALTQSNGQGPTMGDGERLFSAAHGNLFTPAASANIDEIGVSAMRKALLLQTGVDGSTLISVRPDTLVVAPSRLTEAEKFVAAIQPTNTGDVNPFSSKLTVVCEPRLEAVNPFAWYLADSRFAALVLGGLAGNEGPQIASRDGFEVLGREFRVTLDVGVGPNDWRGWAINDGQDSNTSVA
ncbi:prohead protease/major capsid protein fusion protein [Terricaulis sp.]|uniref:prohead protease/major capsid protein fusion protein n=1 Tax=Terricaulis sp. TaxID=2768686 RepID=UPI003784594C